MDKNIGAFLQQLRKSKGLTQKELAEQIGVSDKTISKWENGNSFPDTSMLLPLCNVLDITVNELLTCEKILPENYSIKAEENMISLIEKNKRTEKNNLVIEKIGLVVLCVGVLFLAISNAGLSFPMFRYIDIPSIIIVILLDVGVVLTSGARTKAKILYLLSKTLIPVGLLASIVSAIIMFGYIDTVGLNGSNLSVVLLSLLYSVVAKIVVEILRTKE